MNNSVKNILIALFAFVLLSCNENSNNQEMAIPQGFIADSAAEQEVGNSESVQLPLVIPELSNLTLIPSVEPEQLRNVMPNSWQRLERLTQAEEQELYCLC